MLATIYDVREFDEYTIEEIDGFIKEYKEQLVGSAIFTKSKTFISKFISWVQGIKKRAPYIPSHVAQIIEIGDTLYLFDMKPPRASYQLLREYLINTFDNFRIVLRNYNLDKNQFCKFILEHTNKPYPYLSAIRSYFSKRPTKRSHCSELMLKALQNQHLFKNINTEVTPLELYELLTTTSFTYEEE